MSTPQARRKPKAASLPVSGRDAPHEGGAGHRVARVLWKRPASDDRQGREAALAARADFMRTVVAPAIRPAALELVRSHQQAGDQVAIITATNEFVTRPIAEVFGVSDLMAVELEQDDAPGGTGCLSTCMARTSCWPGGWAMAAVTGRGVGTSPS